VYCLSEHPIFDDLDLHGQGQMTVFWEEFLAILQNHAVNSGFENEVGFHITPMY